MKVQFNFDLNEPDDISDYEIHFQAKKLYFIIQEFSSNYRKKILKFNEEKYTEQQLEAIEDIFNHLFEEINGENINLEI